MYPHIFLIKKSISFQQIWYFSIYIYISNFPMNFPIIFGNIHQYGTRFPYAAGDLSGQSSRHGARSVALLRCSVLFGERAAMIFSWDV